MNVDNIDTSRFTHVHYVFAPLSSNLSVGASSTQNQLDRFINMSDIKRIVSFGGWTDSAYQERYDAVREGVLQPEVFTQSLADFVSGYDLDGLDIGWEYPEAPDVSTSGPQRLVQGLPSRYFGIDTAHDMSAI